MGFETFYQFREVEILCDTSGSMTLTVLTNQPLGGMAPRDTVSIDTPAAPERTTINVRLVGTCRGSLPQFRLAGVNTVRLYGMRVFARPFGEMSGAWQWYSIPVRQTPEGWEARPLPIRATPEDWETRPLPINPSGVTWRWVELPVDAIE